MHRPCDLSFADACLARQQDRHVERRVLTGGGQKGVQRRIGRPQDVFETQPLAQHLALFFELRLHRLTEVFLL